MKPTVIVCPVECASTSTPALIRALALARSYGADLHVVHVTRGGSGDGVADDGFDARVTEWVASLNPERTPAEAVVLSGEPVEAVVRYAEANSADLVVAGQNGRRGTRFWPAGALSQEIARGVHCPTITVPGEAAENADAAGSFTNIVCGINFLPASSAALDAALTLAQQGGGRVTLLHVLERFPYDSAYSGSAAFRLIGEYRTQVGAVTRQLRALVPDDVLNWCEVETDVVSGYPREALVDAASTHRADLLVIGVPARTTARRIVMGSTVGAVLRHARCAVLTVPEPPIGLETAPRAATRSVAFDSSRHDAEGPPC